MRPRQSKPTNGQRENTDLKAAEDALRRSQKQYEDLVADVEGIVWEADAKSFQFTFVSRRAERLLGYPLEQWLEPGFWANHLHPEDRDWAVQFCQKATGEKRNHDFEYRQLAADGRVVWLHDVVKVVVEKGEVTKLRGIMIDVTDRKRAEAALRQSEADRKLALEGGRLGEWKWDLGTGKVIWSSQCKALYGLPPDADITYEKFLSAVHPDDRDRVDAAIKKAVETRTDYDIEKRVIWPDESLHWTSTRGRVFCDARGKPVPMAGVTMDITDRKRAEDALRKTELHLRTLVENFPDFIARFDRECRHLYVNPPVRKAFGHPLEHFVGKTLHELSASGPSGQNDALQAGIRQALEQHLPNTLEARWRTPEGERVFEVRHIPEQDDRGEVVSVLGITRDVTEQRRAEEARRRSEQEARNRLAEIEHIYQHAPIGLFTIDREFRFTRINESLAEINGFPAEEHVGKTLWDMVPNLADHLVEIIRPVFECGDSVRDVEIHGQTLKSPGVDRDWLASYFPVKSETGEVIGLFGAIREVTEQKRAEVALRRSEAYLAEAQRLGRTGSWAWNVGTREFVHWSKEHYRLHGLEPQHGVPSWEVVSRLIHTEDRSRCLEQIERAVQKKSPCEFEYRTVLPDGSIKNIHSIAHPVINAAGELVEFLGSEMDVTERKRAEAALRESELRYREVFNCSSECIFLIDVTPDSRFQFAAFNPAEEQAVGIAAADVAGKFIEDAVPRDLAAAVTANYRRCVEAGSPIEYDEELNLPTGRKSFHTNLVPVHDDSGRIYRILGVARDVTLQRKAEESLRASEETLRRAQAIAHVGSWVFDVREDSFFGSDEGNRICGWDSRPHRAEELLALVHPDDLPLMQTAWQATMAGASYEVEHRLVIDGQVRWVNVRAEPEVDAEGKVVRITGVTQDTTERKRGEEALRASLHEKEALLREVHHRVKNNLQLISSLLSLQASAIKDPTVVELFAESKNRVRSMALVHENLYRAGNFTAISMAGHVESLCAHLVRSYSIMNQAIDLRNSIADVQLDIERAIPCGLIVNELVSNSLKHAFPDGQAGEIRVGLRLTDQKLYRLEISDNGIGLTPNLNVSKADSVGLQLVNDLTHQLHGSMDVSRVGGTTFTITFSADGRRERM